MCNVRRLFVFSAILTPILLFSTYACAQVVGVDYPDSGDLAQQVEGRGEIQASAVASSVPVGGWVEFVLDIGKSSERTERLTTFPYSTAFTSVPRGEHTLDVYVVNSLGVRLAAADQVDRLGVGDILVAVGDSITAGEVDNITSDNYSADGRNGPKDGYGGYEPILNDLLTQIKAYPHFVPNEGVPGENTGGAKIRIAELIAKYPTARTWLIAYGTNDANGSMSNSTFKSNLKSIINQIQSAIPDAHVYVPRIFYHDHSTSRAGYVDSYNNTIAGLTFTMANVFRGADLDTLFRANHQTFPNHMLGQAGSWLGTGKTHHPNGVGVQKMAMLWRMALVDGAFLVTDGTYTTLGDLTNDRVEVEPVNTIGLNGNNLLEICDFRGKGAPPAGAVFVGDWRVKLMLTGADAFVGDTSYVTLRVDDTGLLPTGVGWNKVFLARDDVVLETFRGVNSGNDTIHYLTAKVDRPGAISPVLVLDMAAPVTMLTIDPRTPNGLNGWYSVQPKITLISKDVFGNNADIYYKWDKGTESRYSSGIFPPGGKHTLYYYGVDASANAEDLRSYVVKTDTTPSSTPTVTTDVQSVKLGGYVKATWYAKDTESGVDKYMYAIGTDPGRTNIRGWTSVGLTTSVSWKTTGSVGTKYYFSVKTRNRAGIYSDIGVSGSVTVIR